MRRFKKAIRAFGEKTGHSFDVGLADLQAQDTLEDFLARADAALYATRTSRQSPGALAN